MALASLYSLFYYAKDTKSIPTIKQSSIYVEKAIEYLNSNFSNSELKINHVAEKLHLSVEYLSKIFKEETQTTPIAFLISKRMEEAHKLLKLGVTVSESAEKCGYVDLCNFSKTYSKRFGYPPSKTP
jgi:two-component system response regulator YesN